MKRKSMIFLSPEGDAGGGTAVADPPASTAPAEADMGSIGQAYTEALNDGQAKAVKAEEESPTVPQDKTKSTGPTGATGVKGPEASEGKGATGPTGVSAPTKPASALDAALENSVVTGPTGVTASEDFLKDLPETLPREGRGEHWTRARGAITKLGTTVSEQSKTIAELTKQIEAGKATPADVTARVAQLEKENADYKDAMVAINVEYEPEHRKKFVEGRTNLVAKAASKLNAFGGKGETITEALNMPEGRGRTQLIKEALAELEPVEQNRVLQFVSEVEKLDDERAEIMKDPQGAWSKLQESEKARVTAAAKQREEFKKTMFDKMFVELPKSHFLLREVDPSVTGAKEHNEGVKAMREAAFALLRSDAKPEDLIESAFAKQEVPKLQELLLSSRKELQTALTALREYEGASPGFRGDKPPAKTELEQNLERSPGDIYKELLRKSAGGE